MNPENIKNTSKFGGWGLTLVSYKKKYNSGISSFYFVFMGYVGRVKGAVFSLKNKMFAISPGAMEIIPKKVNSYII